MKILDFKQNPFKMKINPMTGDTRSGRSCFRARFVFRWKTWVQNPTFQYNSLNQTKMTFYCTFNYRPSLLMSYVNAAIVPMPPMKIWVYHAALPHHTDGRAIHSQMLQPVLQLRPAANRLWVKNTVKYPP